MHLIRFLHQDKAKRTKGADLMREILTVLFVSTASLATADNFVDAITSGDALRA